MLSLAYHLQQPLAGLVAVDALTAALNREIEGDLQIGELQNVSWEKLVARAVVIRDPEGREVIRVDRLALWPDFSSIAAGDIRVERARARGGEVTLYAGEGDDVAAVSIADAFALVNPSADNDEPSAIRVVIDGIVIDDMLVQGDVPGYEDLRVEGARVEARVDIGDDVVVHIFDGRGSLAGPYAGHTPIDRIVGHISTVDGIDLFVRGHRDEDRFEARLLLTIPADDETPLELDLTAQADPVRISTLREMEVVEGLDALEGTFTGYARLSGPVDDLRLRADMTSQAGRIHVRSHLPAEGVLSIDAWTDGRLRVDRLVPGAPEMAVEARARLEIEEVGEGEDAHQVRRLHATAEPFSLPEVAIPAVELDALIEDDALIIEELTAEPGGGELSASGRIGFDASLDVHAVARIPRIQNERNVQRYAPDARGSLTADVNVLADEDFENLRFEGRVSLRNGAYSSVRASSLNLRGSVSQLSAAPVLRVDGTAEGLRIADLTLGRASVSIHGGPGGYSLLAETRDNASGTHLLVEGRAHASEDRFTLNAPTLVVDLGPGEAFRGRLELTLRPGSSVSISPLELRRGDERIAANGTYRFNGDDDIDVQVTGVDLASLRPLSPEYLQGLGGHVDGTIAVRGDLDRRPQGEISLRIQDGSFRNLDGIDGSVDANLEGLTLNTDVHLDLGEHGALALEGPVELTESSLRDPASILEEAVLDGVIARARELDLGLLAALGLVEDFPVSGRISTNLDLAGRPSAPGLRDAVIIFDHITMEGWDPLRAKVRLSYSEERVIVRNAWVADVVGELASAQGEFPFSFDDPPSDLPSLWRQLNAGRFSASAHIAQRRLDSYPRPIRGSAPPGLEVSASITAESSPIGPVAELEGVARFVEAATEDGCAAELRPMGIIRGRLEGNVAIAHLTGFLSGDRADVEADATANLPLEQWLRAGEVAEIPTVEVTARIDGADLGDVPWLCDYGRGLMTGQLRVENALGDSPRLSAIVDVPELQIWESSGDSNHLSPRYRAHVRAGSTEDRDALTVCSIVGLSDDPGTYGPQCREVDRAAPGELISRLRIPVSFTRGEILPALSEDGRIISWNDLRSVHVEPILAFVPGITAGDAVVSGTLEAEGVWPEMTLMGGIDLEQGRLQIVGLGQHLSEIQGRLEFHGNEAVIPAGSPIQARDSGGTLLINGSVTLEGLRPQELQLSLSADSFPVRREGMELARLTGTAAVTGTFSEERTNSRIEIHDFLVRLPEQTAATLQSLEPHANILVVGSERPRGAGAANEAYPIEIEIDAHDPFWVRRNDFSALIDARLVALYQDPDLRVDGVADIRRGTFEIFGKRFELRRGQLAFDGGTELDPRIFVLAVYAIPGREAATVTVTVSGTLTSPRVAFTSTETNDGAEIISLLISGGRQEPGSAAEEASEQAASFVAGITAGLLTLGLRQEFGDIIPVLAIESEANGGTRIRAGYDANDWIPDFLEDIVTGAYVEGFVTAAADGTNAAGSSSGGGGVGGGVSLELNFPENFTARGTYVPVDNLSFDVLFEPQLP